MTLDEIAIRDPFILTDERTEKYYMYASSQPPLAKGFCMYVSDDLKNWQAPQSVFAVDDSFWAHDDFWAPEVHCYGGKYYLFATFGKKDVARTSQILISDSPMGPFELHSDAIAPKDWFALDATLYVKDGQPYTIFSHEWVQVFDGEMCYTKLSDDLSRTCGEPVTMFKASDSGWAKVPGWSQNEREVYITDAPFVYNIDGVEFMLWSSWSQNIQEAYSVGVVYPVGVDMLCGKYEHCLLDLPHKDAGHAMIFKDFDGNYKICYHTNNSQSGGERAAIVSVKIKEGKLCAYEN